MSKTPFILVHGAFHGGWCWESVVPLLEAAGHQVCAPSLPGMAGDPTPLDQITLAHVADFIADLVREQPEPAILVGHSMGGVAISEAAERIPDLVRGLVFLSAMLIPGGTSLNDHSIPEIEELSRHAIISGDGISMTFPPEIALAAFYNTTDPNEARRAVARLTPQPVMPISEPLTVTAGRFGRIPRAYIECTEDRALPIVVQRRLRAVLPCRPVLTMTTDHSPFLCRPAELAEHLIAAAAAFGG